VQNSLTLYFTIAFIIPIIAAIIATLKGGLHPALVVSAQLSAMALVVLMAMVHAPAIAAMVASYKDLRFAGIKNLFRQLKYWEFAVWFYIKALFIFPVAILASLWVLSFFSTSYTPVFSPKMLVIGALFSALWEEIGWTGYATPHLLRKFSPLKTAILLGIIHAFWHLAADYWGSAAFYGNLYVIHFLLWVVGLTLLRILIVQIYSRTRSLVLGWLAHASFTGSQLWFVSLTLTSTETVIWYTLFVFLLLLLVIFLSTSKITLSSQKKAE